MMIHNPPEARRAMLGLAAAGVGIAAASIGSEAQAQAPGLFAAWVHGHSVVLERAIFSPSKGGVGAAFPTGRAVDGDVRDMADFASIAVSRLGWGARFVVFDHGTGDFPKSGQIWCHYAVPTPVIVANRRARLRQILLVHTTPTPMQLAINAVHVWDAGERVFQANDIIGMSPEIFAAALPDREVRFGMGVSLLISANNARNTFLDIGAVGIDFAV